MKDNFKLRKIQKENVTLRDDFDALREHMAGLTLEVRQEQQNAADEISKLTKLRKEDAEKIEEFKEKI
jgi:predicted  nucleic acid-binding Zn-ribbon protein